MTYPALTLAPPRANGADHPSQLVQNLDALMRHLNEVQPEDGFPQPATVINPSSVKDPPRLWDKLKGVARRLAHPQDHQLIEQPEPDHPVGVLTRHVPVMPEHIHATVLHGELTVNGLAIRRRSGLYSLNDLYHASGAKLSRLPSRFLKKKETLWLARMLTDQNSGKPALHQTKQRGQGREGCVWDTWGQRELLFAYAGWVSQALLDAVRKALLADDAQQDEIVPPFSCAPTEKKGVFKFEQTSDSGNNTFPPKDAQSTTTTFKQLNVDIGSHLDGVTMTSGEIAELVNSRHEDVRRSIDRLVKRGVIRKPPIALSEKINNLGLVQKIRHYVFFGEQGKRDSIVVVGQLAPESIIHLNDWWERAESSGKKEGSVTKSPRAPLSEPLDYVQIDVDALTGSLTMSSLEIAELAGKQHRNVLRDIREMLAKLYGNKGEHRFEHTHVNPQNNQVYPIFRLPKDLTLTLVAGYSMLLRKRIIDRWLELEKQVAIGAFGVPRTLQDALRMAADLLDENQTLRLENQALKQLPAPAQGAKAGQAGGEADDLSGALTVAELARSLRLGRNWLCSFLRDEQLLLRSGAAHTPANRYLKDGFFAFRPSVRKLKKSGDAPFMQLVVTTQGQEHIQQRLLTLGLLPGYMGGGSKDA